MPPVSDIQTLPRPGEAGTVIVGMSGGVDSAVAALLLKEAGFTVQGLFMSNWDADDSYCTVAEDFQDARRSCETLNIPLHRVSFAAEYRERVFAHFLREYDAGRTPNPDVLCNREIKFGVCLQHMHRLGASWIATGHYARLARTSSGVQLMKAADGAKDQSYFLHQVGADALNRTLFPLGNLRKDEVRRRAHAAGLGVFDKPDSTGICFIGERPFEDFLTGHLPQTPGPIETPDGRVIGEHRGLAVYTLGQRSGLRIGGRSDSNAAPWYVAAKEARRNALIVVQDPGHPLLLSDAFEVTDVRWLGSISPGELAADRLGVKTRYRQPDLPCAIEGVGVDTPGVDTPGVETPGVDTLHVNLRTPARSVTPGQYAVFYSGDRCLGGGVIARRHNSISARGAVASAPEPA